MLVKIGDFVFFVVIQVEMRIHFLSELLFNSDIVGRCV